MPDFLFETDINQLDPQVKNVIDQEKARQENKLILIPSESSAPPAVLACLGSVFQNLYAEGYPDEETRWMAESELLDFTDRLNYFRRHSDPRYYKGVEFADIIESLARRRCAQLFATKQISPDDLYVNVQPLSGAPANNAVYHALLEPGDTIMGLSLLHGGHLTHGSSVNRSGTLYKAIHYSVNPSNEQIDYSMVEKLAQEHKPRLIIAGYSSYPWVPDWKIFKEIAKSIGAFLLADISHIAGMIAAECMPSPVGYADVITSTTHKTLCGPRGAFILATGENIAKKIDRAIFPGEQGGPHVNTIAAMAVTFKLAMSKNFRDLQSQILKNCKVLNDKLLKRGLRIAYGGTNTHLTNIDCKSIQGTDGAYLSGDMAARILDIVGLVTNPNTIPGDKSSLNASGLRLGTPWVTQRGLQETEMTAIADMIADVLFACQPYQIEVRSGTSVRAKVDFKILEDTKVKVRELVDKYNKENSIQRQGYPFFYYFDDKSQLSNDNKFVTFEIKGEFVRQFMNYVFTADIEDLQPGLYQKSTLVTTEGHTEGFISLLNPHTYFFTVPVENSGLVSTWLRDLSDGYTFFDIDLMRRIPGPISILEVAPISTYKLIEKPSIAKNKPFYISVVDEDGEKLKKFTWHEPENQALKHTPLFETHISLSAKMVPFAGWEMPVWYTSVVEEHLAVRRNAGLFDVAHMGVYKAEGPDALVFLDCVCANDISSLAIGESCYTHYLDTNADVLDDLLIYRLGQEEYLIVVNASNEDKDWAWLNSIRKGEIMVDPKRTWARAFGRNVILRNFRDSKEGEAMLVDMALQGPKSKEILLSLPWQKVDYKRISNLKRTQLCSADLQGTNIIISRTGYTGEKVAFELFTHPDQLVRLWNLLLEKGSSFGLKPCGLGARDSLRTEAGLPLYGHEMGGKLNLGVGEAGFSSYVKTHKPWFIGRDAYIQREKNRQTIVIRFRFDHQHVRMAHLGDPVLEENGKVIGMVTSCAIDQNGFITGQASIEQKYAVENNAIYIFQNADQQNELMINKLKPGDRASLPTKATILSRFP